MRQVSTLNEALEFIEKNDVSLVICDYLIPEMDGIQLFQYIEKPRENDNLLLIIRNGIEKFKLLQQLRDKIKQFNSAYDDLRGMQEEILKAFV